MIKHTIYTEGGNYAGSFVEYYGPDDAGNKQTIARGFTCIESVGLFIEMLREQFDCNVCNWYVIE